MSEDKPDPSVWTDPLPAFTPKEYIPPPPKKKRTKPGGNNPSGVSPESIKLAYKFLAPPPGSGSGNPDSLPPPYEDPESVGRMRRPHPWHMSVNELIEYKSSGMKPAMVLDPDLLFNMARIGVTKKDAATLCGVSDAFINDHPVMLDAWQRGRSEVATRIRASLVEDALEKDVLNAKIYLDKVMNPAESTQTVKVEHSIAKENPLEAIPTENLLEVLYRDADPPSN